MGLAPIGSTDEHSSPVLPEGRVDAHGLVADDRSSAPRSRPRHETVIRKHRSD